MHLFGLQVDLLQLFFLMKSTTLLHKAVEREYMQVLFLAVLSLQLSLFFFLMKISLYLLKEDVGGFKVEVQSCY